MARPGHRHALADAGLHIVLCTPTATPPKWLVDSDPTMLAVDARGRPRRFGSRRHYCFSSRSYRAACARIVTALAERYGTHPAVQAWQTDNEFGCHDTTISYSPAAAQAFRQWLAGRYTDIAALNRAWGNVFWSMEYRSFEEIDPPNLTVTEANPSHRLDYNRFASEEVAPVQSRCRPISCGGTSPGRPIAHNFMGFTTSFDHYDVAADLDIAVLGQLSAGLSRSVLVRRRRKGRAICGRDIPTSPPSITICIAAAAAAAGGSWNSSPGR